MQDFRVVYDPELDPKKRFKLKKSYGNPTLKSDIDPRSIQNYIKLGKGKTKLVKEYGPVLFEFDEFSKTGPVPTSILLTTSPKVDQNELLMVIQEIGKLESFSFAKNHQGLLLASITFGHSSAARDAALKWNGTRVNDHKVDIELDEDCQKFYNRKIKADQGKKVVEKCDWSQSRRESSPSRSSNAPRSRHERDKRHENTDKRLKSDHSSDRYESRYYRPEKEHYSKYKADIESHHRKENYRVEEKKTEIIVKEKSVRNPPKSAFRIVQEEIVSIVERDYQNRIILQMITDFIGKSLPPPSIIMDTQESVSSITSISLELKEKVRRPLPSFKKLKTSEPVEKTSSRLIKKNYKLLSKKKRFYMESDADSSSSSSSSGSSNSESDEDVVEEIQVDKVSSQEDLMEVDVDENIIADIPVQEESPVADPITITNPKVTKKSRSRKSVQKKARRQTKEQITYQKPIRIPFNFDKYEERFAELRAQNFLPAQVPDGDFDADVLLSISGIDLNEMGYDSEDQSIIHNMLNQEAAIRKVFRSKTLYDADGQRCHLTGSARSEGHYAISSAEKKAHLRVVSHKNRDATISPSKIPTVPTNIPNDMRISSSRASRFTQRQLVIGPDSKKPPVPIDSAESVRFKQMKNRKRRLKFAKSDIHDWGLFAMEKIEANEMIIEYIGEKIRLKIADLREIEYEKQGIGSSYLFRVDDDIVIDATKMGNLARFINHCCEPNCYAKIINIDGTKRIIIYANVDIEEGEEITYDYKFPIEDDKIPCLCGAVVGLSFLKKELPRYFELMSVTEPPACSSDRAASCPVSSSSSSLSGCPVDHSKVNPLNNMPNLSQEKAPGQTIDLATVRTFSSIPKTKIDEGPVWEYPSPQQFYNALVRKGWKTPETEIPVIVDIHNFINEECWDQIKYWETKFHCDCKDISLLKFQGRPKDMTPKAFFYHYIYGSEKPFDRHDWTVDRCGKPVRYVIDYYGGPNEGSNPVFHCDIRPALDSPSAFFDRLRESASRVWSKLFS